MSEQIRSRPILRNGVVTRRVHESGNKVKVTRETSTLCRNIYIIPEIQVVMSDAVGARCKLRATKGLVRHCGAYQYHSCWFRVCGVLLCLVVVITQCDQPRTPRDKKAQVPSSEAIVMVISLLDVWQIRPRIA